MASLIRLKTTDPNLRRIRVAQSFGWFPEMEQTK